MSRDEHNQGQGSGQDFSAPYDESSPAPQETALPAGVAGSLDHLHEGQTYLGSPDPVSEGSYQSMNGHEAYLYAPYPDHMEHEIAGIPSRSDEIHMETTLMPPDEPHAGVEANGASYGYLYPSDTRLGLMVDTYWENGNGHVSPAFGTSVAALDGSRSAEGSMTEPQPLWFHQGAVTRRVRAYRAGQEHQAVGIVYLFDPSEDARAILRTFTLSYPQNAHPNAGAPRYPQEVVLESPPNGRNHSR
ncbi:hypothetical protein GQ53DRAFT_750469 [Thozetella sp. PMI_491]|nr:hypothetical protein GQ53DRAFT_750469 [Thozetella sp. PMI_491]